MVDLVVLLFFTIDGVTLTLLFLDTRFSIRKTCFIVYGVTAVLLLVNIVLFIRLGYDRMLQLYTLTNHIPCMLTLAYVSRTRGWQLLFQLLSGVMFCALIQQAGTLAYYVAGHRSWVKYLTYGVFTMGIALYILRCLRPLFLQVLHQIGRGWQLMCLVLGLYYGIVFYMSPGYMGVSKASVILKPTVSALVVGFYAVAFALFLSIQRETENRYAVELLAIRLSALQRQLDAVHSLEEAMRIERHDLRHRFQTTAALVAQGRKQEALKFLGVAVQHLDAMTPVQWCKLPILDAVFSFYFSQAKSKGIQVKAEIALHGNLPVDEAELALVFANGLENAINACMTLPPVERKLRCKAISCPGLMLEILNPCAKEINFDENGLPISDREGHGLGTKSIAAFCEKYSALCRYEAENGWFCMRIIL